jgi:phosphoribosylformimino-5-aminoimidazole carboxamide ribotide isomerase
MGKTSFTIFPAIDLRSGKVVRLAQGDPLRQTTYGDDPLAWAERWKSAGAGWLHVVNLDGAFGEETQANMKTLQALLGIGLKVECGGGVRDRAAITRLLEMGVERVFLGTAAIQNPTVVDWAISKYGAVHIAADIGTCEGRVMVKGWQEATSLTVLEAGKRLREQGLEWCVLTDVQRDGTGAGVNVTTAEELQTVTGLKVVASGGVHSLEEIRQARAAGLAGVILGKALYDGQLSLSDCLASV